MYTDINFKTKKALKEAVTAGKQITCFNPGASVTGIPAPRNGTISLEGPHFPQPHKWYASGTMKDGLLVAVK
jgi:hypothetical protein